MFLSLHVAFTKTVLHHLCLSGNHRPGRGIRGELCGVGTFITGGSLWKKIFFPGEMTLFCSLYHLWTTPWKNDFMSHMRWCVSQIMCQNYNHNREILGQLRHFRASRPWSILAKHSGLMFENLSTSWNMHWHSQTSEELQVQWGKSCYTSGKSSNPSTHSS